MRRDNLGGPAAYTLRPAARQGADNGRRRVTVPPVFHALVTTDTQHRPRVNDAHEHTLASPQERATIPLLLKSPNWLTSTAHGFGVFRGMCSTVRVLRTA